MGGFVEEVEGEGEAEAVEEKEALGCHGEAAEGDNRGGEEDGETVGLGESRGGENAVGEFKERGDGDI